MSAGCWRKSACRKKKCTGGEAARHPPRKKQRPDLGTDLASNVAAPPVKKHGRIRIVLEMIKFEHSVFALPFALIGALLGARATGAFPTGRQLVWIIVAMVGARSAA